MEEEKLGKRCDSCDVCLVVVEKSRKLIIGKCPNCKRETLFVRVERGKHNDLYKLD